MTDGYYPYSYISLLQWDVPLKNNSNLRLPHQKPVYISVLSHTCQMLHPTNLAWFVSSAFTKLLIVDSGMWISFKNFGRGEQFFLNCFHTKISSSNSVRKRSLYYVLFWYRFYDELILYERFLSPVWLDSRQLPLWERSEAYLHCRAVEHVSKSHIRWKCLTNGQGS